MKLRSELNEANNRLNCLTIRGKTINNMLGVKKPSHDKCDLGFFETCSSFMCTNTEVVEKSLHVTSLAKSSLKKRFIPTCHHYGELGHIRPICRKLSLETKNDLKDQVVVKNNIMAQVVDSSTTNNIMSFSR